MRFVYSKPVLVLLVILLIVVARAIWGIYPKEQAATVARAREQATLDQLTLDRANLEADLKFLATPRGQEELLRQKFPVARPGEHVITVPPTRPKSAKANIEAGPPQWP